jgi:hypothetical protein
MRNYIHSERQRTGNKFNGQYHYYGYYTYGLNQGHISQSKGPGYLFRRP